VTAVPDLASLEPDVVENPELPEKARPLRLFPCELEVGDEARHEDEIERPVPDNLVGDVEIAAPRVGDPRDRHGSSLRPAEAWSKARPRRSGRGRVESRGHGAP
jgi:hypothetical protein